MGGALENQGIGSQNTPASFVRGSGSYSHPLNFCFLIDDYTSKWQDDAFVDSSKNKGVVRSLLGTVVLEEEIITALWCGLLRRPRRLLRLLGCFRDRGDHHLLDPPSFILK